MIKLRDAHAEDSRWVWELANEPTVRAVSFHSAPIPWEDHKKWYSAQLADADCLFFIAEDEAGTSVGQVRFAISGDEAVISISIHASQRGKGLGTELIKQSSDELFQKTQVKRILAYTRPDNGASVKAFEKAGYTNNGCCRKNDSKAIELILDQSSPDILSGSANGQDARSTLGIRIQGRKIGPGQPVYIIAEISANHNGEYERAAELIRIAHHAGADAVKLQTYTADTLTIDCRNEYFTIGGGTAWAGRNFYDLYSEAYTPWEWQPDLKKLADGLGIACFSTPFDATAVDFLEQMSVPAYKIASFEIVDLPLIRKVAEKQKPVIISTGMATLPEIEDAANTVRHTGNEQLVLLKCTSSYPARVDEMNLRTIPDLAKRFNCVAGLSDHTLGSEVAIAAVSLGANVIEKHITISRADGGPDAGFSMEAEEFTQFVDAIRKVEKSLGNINYKVNETEKNSRIFRRSLFAVADIKAGETLSHKNIRSIRPGYGLPPKYIDEIIGCRATSDIKKGTPLNWNLIEGSDK